MQMNGHLLIILVTYPICFALKISIKCLLTQNADFR